MKKIDPNEASKTLIPSKSHKKSTKGENARGRLEGGQAKHLWGWTSIKRIHVYAIIFQTTNDPQQLKKQLWTILATIKLM